MDWRRIKTADYSKFNLTVINEYLSFRKDQYVHNHKGELLFFYNYIPDDIDIHNHTQFSPSYEEMLLLNRPMIVQYDGWRSFAICKGVDCDGVPTFAHIDADYIGTHRLDPEMFEPLTVGVVLQWYYWFISNLKNGTITTVF